jgi:hypothetical protein
MGTPEQILRTINQADANDFSRSGSYGNFTFEINRELKPLYHQPMGLEHMFPPKADALPYKT